MSAARYRPVYVAAGVLALVWALAWGGYQWASRAKMTAEKFAAQARQLDLRTLRGDARARALEALAANLNRLSWEERRRMRLERRMDGLFEQMTEAEKGRFIEATLPTGFKQMLTSFEQLPEDRRQRAITNALERMRRDRDSGQPPEAATNRPPVLSPELQKKAMAVGLRTFFNESSAQTKAELAPLLEELQRQMESGRFILHPR